MQCGGQRGRPPYFHMGSRRPRLAATAAKSPRVFRKRCLRTHVAYCAASAWSSSWAALSYRRQATCGAVRGGCGCRGAQDVRGWALRGWAPGTFSSGECDQTWRASGECQTRRASDLPLHLKQHCKVTNGRRTPSSSPHASGWRHVLCAFTSLDQRYLYFRPITPCTGHLALIVSGWTAPVAAPDARATWIPSSLPAAPGYMLQHIFQMVRRVLGRVACARPPSCWLVA